eukprot:TRINITY_DN21769_c0_g3_i1.p1 TRINITY_DN21769_c0_g3~~TRINITY_DN21769_c0_g3_i1.p1  ORF type:complete len:1517 (+),score=551.36 TRINITY_DN21769_c0_g3_i1:666-4553(+)
MDADGVQGHRDCITHMLHNHINDVYYTASADGTVRQWNPQEGTLSGSLIHGCAGNTSITDMKWIRETNRLVVLQMDRIVAVYDCGMIGRSRRNPLLRMYKGVEGVAGSEMLGPFPRTKPIAHRLVDAAPDPLQHPYQQLAALRTQKKSRHSDEVISELEQLFGGHLGTTQDREVQAVEATPLDDLTQSTMCVDYAHWAQGGSWLVGCEGGAVNYYLSHGRGETLEDGDQSKPLAKWRPHGPGWVTHLQAVTSLDGFISSSTDETIQVFNMEKGQSYVTMRDTSGVHNVLRWGPRENKGIYGFDYAPELNLLASWGENRKFIIWNPLTGLSLFQRMEHTRPLTRVLFKPNHQLISLSEDKTIKVWDTRTFRCVQTLVDKTPRLPEDRYRCLAYDKLRSTIVTGAACPVLFRMRVVQEKMDAGISVHKQVGGHSQPVTSVLYNPKFGHVVTIDRDTVFTWDLATGKQLSVWHPDVLQVKRSSVSPDDQTKRISAACLGHRMRRLLCCVDDGNVHVFNYIKNITLKTFVSGSREELCCCLTAVANEGMPYAESYVIVGGLAKRVYLFKDQELLSAPGDQQEQVRPCNTLPIENHGFAYAVDFVAPARLLVGTHKGVLLLFNLNNMSLMSTCNANPSVSANLMKGGDLLRNAAQWGRRQSVDAKAVVSAGSGLSGAAESDPFALSPQLPPLQEGGLFQRLRAVRNHVRRISGAQAFLNFHAITQQHTTGMVSAMCFVSATILCTLHGNGQLCVWRVTKETAQASIALCVPASYQAGEAAAAVAYAPALARLYVGDDRGYVSVFDLEKCIASLHDRDSGARRPRGATVVSTRKGSHRYSGVSLPPLDSSARPNLTLSSGSPPLSPVSPTSPGRKRLRVVSRVLRGGIGREPSTVTTPEKQQNQNPRAVRNEHGIVLAACFKAHQSFVGCVSPVPLSQARQSLLVTAGGDCAVKVWSGMGQPLACFGRRGRWPRLLRPGDMDAAAPKLVPPAGCVIAVSGPADAAEAAEAEVRNDEAKETQVAPTSPPPGLLPPDLSRRLSRRNSHFGPSLQLPADEAPPPQTGPPVTSCSSESGESQEPHDDFMSPQELDEDTRDSISGHYFATIFPKHVATSGDRAAVLGDVLDAQNAAVRRSVSAPPPERPDVLRDAGAEHPLTPDPRPVTPPGGGYGGRADSDSSGVSDEGAKEEQSNLERMIDYSMRRTRDPATRKILELQRLEAAETYKSSWDLDTTIPLALQEVRDRARTRNPLSSQYSVLKVPQPNQRAAQQPWQVATRRGLQWPAPAAAQRRGGDGIGGPRH